VLVPKVEFISAPGWSPPEVERRGGPQALLTGMALFAWQPDRRRFRLESVHPGHTAADIRAQTGFDYDGKDCDAATPAPDDDSLALMRGAVAREIAPDYPDYAARLWGGNL
jgi:glutaconate CoA-transferase subunit B